MLWEVEIKPVQGQRDSEGNRVLAESKVLAADTISTVTSARSFLIESDATEPEIVRYATQLLGDSVVETLQVRALNGSSLSNSSDQLVNILYKPGVTDNVGSSTKDAFLRLGLDVETVATCRKYWFNQDAAASDVERVSTKVLANDAIEQVITGDLQLDSISVGSEYKFHLSHVRIREMDDAALVQLSKPVNCI